MFFGDGELARIVFDEFEILKGYKREFHFFFKDFWEIFWNFRIERGNNEWKLQQEAFEPRPEIIRANSDITDGYDSGINHPSASPSTVPESDGVGSMNRQLTSQTRSFININPQSSKIMPFDSYSLIKDVLTTLVEEVTQYFFSLSKRLSLQNFFTLFVFQGDLQMAVSLLILLGDKGRHMIDEFTQTYWYKAYIGKF